MTMVCMNAHKKSKAPALPFLNGLGCPSSVLSLNPVIFPRYLVKTLSMKTAAVDKKLYDF